MFQSEHSAWNAQNYPGTRQMCIKCDEPTGRCEDDTLCTEDGFGPLCEECWRKTPENLPPNVQA